MIVTSYLLTIDFLFVYYWDVLFPDIWQKSGWRVINGNVMDAAEMTLVFILSATDNLLMSHLISLIGEAGRNTEQNISLRQTLWENRGSDGTTGSLAGFYGGDMRCYKEGCWTSDFN